MKKICWNSFHRDTSSKTMKRYAQLVMLLHQLLGESLCIFKHATRYLLPILCDSRSDVNCGSIQLFSWDSADRCDQANSIARGQNSSRDSITYAFVERARRVDLLSLPHNLHAHNVAWLWPGPICRWFGRVKPTRVIQILSRALVFDARSTKKTSNESRIEDSLNPGSMNPLLGNVLPFFRSVITPPLLRSILWRKIHWNFAFSPMRKLTDMEISKFEAGYFYSRLWTEGYILSFA